MFKKIKLPVREGRKKMITIIHSKGLEWSCHSNQVISEEALVVIIRQVTMVT